MAYVCRSHNTSNLIHGVQIRTQPSVHTEYLFIDNGRNRHAVEHIGKGFPQLYVISSLAFIVEAVYTVHRGTFMVSSQKKEVLGILNLVSHGQAHYLQGLFAVVHVIAQEHIICLGWKSAVLETSEKIVVLSVNVTDDLTISAEIAHKTRKIAPGLPLVELLILAVSAEK